MDKIPVIGTGLSGLVGSRLVKDFSETYAFQNFDLSDSIAPVDITDASQVQRAVENSTADFIVHCAAFTDVTQAWLQSDDRNGLAYRVNVVGTENIVRAAENAHKHLIHISTAYVFNGEKDGMYVEEDIVRPIEWYGQTKAMAEEKVQSSNCQWTILRIDQPFRSDPFLKQDVVHRIASSLKSNSLYPQFTNHCFGPTFIDDFVKVIDWVLRTKTTGLFHASSGEKWSDYDFASEVKNILHLRGEVKQGDLNEYLKTVNRPYQKNTALDCSKLKRVIDFEMNNIRSAISFVSL